MADRLKGLLEHGRPALVLTEIQEGILGPSAPWPILAEAAAKVRLVDHARELADAARAHGAPVVHCTAENLPGHFGGNANGRLFASARKLRPESGAHPLDEPLAELWRDGDVKLPRYHGLSAMTGSPLDSLLRNRGTTSLIICGVSLTFGVLSLVLDAVNRAYQVILPRDAVAGFPEDYAEMVMTNTLAMVTTIASTEEILDAWN